MFRFFPWWKPNRTQPRSAKRRPYRRRPELESLEDRVVPATFHVALGGSDGNTGGTADPFRTIQAAINAAAAFADGADEIRVAAGTYNQAGSDLAFSVPNDADISSLKILGGWDALFSSQSPQATIYIPQSAGDPNTYDVDINNPSTTLDNFTFVFDGVEGDGGTRPSGGILFNSASNGSAVSNNIIEAGYGRLVGGARSVGVQTAAGATNLTISNNFILANATQDTDTSGRSYRTQGIFLNPGSGNVQITGNTLSGPSFATIVVVKEVSNITIQDNTVSRTGVVTGFAAIEVRNTGSTGPYTNIAIVGNTVDGADNGVGLGSGGSQALTNVSVNRNVVSNHVVPSSGYGIYVAPGTGSVNATLNYNSITGNTVGLQRFAGSATIDATRNWWDHVSGPTTAANPGGLGQAINDTTGISFRPWLVYSPDNDPLTPGVQLPTTVNILAGNDVSAAENDFTLLQNAVGAVAAGQTLNLSGDFDWTATNAAVEYNASTNTSATADIRGVELPGGVHDVTITSTLSDAHILGIGDSADSLYNSFLFADDGPSVGNMNFVLEKLNIDDFENAVMFGWNGTGTFTGTKIRDNLITIGGDDGDLSDLQNIAIYFAAGTNQQITGNTVTFQGDGIRNVGSGARSFGFQNNTTGGALYDNLLIDNNTFQLASTSAVNEIIHGIWENGHNDDNSADIAITNNRFLGRTGVDDFDRALFLTSQTDGLVIDGNTFTDVDNVLFSRNAAGGVEAGDEFTFTNNVLTRVGGSDGVFLRNVTDDATPITVVVHWNVNNTIDGFTGVRGLNELAMSAARPITAASDLNAVFGAGTRASVFVDDGFSGAARFSDPDGIGSGVDPAAFGFNVFSSIQAGVGAVDAGGTVNVAAGTYAENVLVTKSVALLGPNAGVNPNTGSRVAEAIVVPAVTETSLQASTSGTIFRLGTMAGHIDVTIDGFTIDGHNASLTGGRMLNGVEVHTGAGIINSVGSFDTNPGGHDVTMTVHNNIIQNLERYGVLGDNIASRAPRAGSDVSFNKIDNLPSGNNFGGGRGRGVAYEENFYGSVTHNVITRVNVGWQNDNYNLASPGAGTLVDNNEIHTYHRGIFHNLQYQSATPATISNNRIFVETDGDFAASATNFGIELASIQDAVGATVTNNNVTGTVYGILLWNLPTTGTITVSGGTLMSNTFGILATNFDPQFLGVSAGTSATIDNVRISFATTAGIKVEDHPDTAATGAVALTIQNNTTVAGSSKGVLVSGGNASATVNGNLSSFSGNLVGIDIDGGSAAVTNNSIFGNTVGVRVTNGGILTAFANNDLDDSVDNDTDLRIDSTAGSVTVGTGNQFAGEVFYIDNQSSQNLTATGNTFDETNNFRIEDKMSHKVDNLAQGRVTWVANNIYVTTPGMTSTDSVIQRGIDAASTGFTVNVEFGTYAENLSIPTAITLKGAQAGQDADTRFAAFVGGANGPKADPTVETVLTTPVNDPTGTTPSPNDLVRVLISGVTVDGFVLDGNNPALGASTVVGPNGVAIHARRGIVNRDTAGVFHDLNNLLVQNNIIQNVSQRGVSLANDTIVSTGNLITGNVITSYGADPVNGGLGIILFTNAYADVTDNTIIDTIGGGFGTGIQLQNFFGDGTMTWSGNRLTVAQDDIGIIANLFYAANATLNINNNTINAATGVTPTSDFTWGVYVLSVQVGSTVSLSGNTIGSMGGTFDRGIYLWNLPTSNTVSVSGGAIHLTNVGIDVASVDPFFGAGATTTVNIENVAIMSGSVGVRVRAVPVNQTFPPPASVDPAASVTANLSGVSIQNVITGVLVEGFDSTITAAASLFQSSISSATTGVQVNANGILAPSAQNFISNNTTGVGVASGAGSVTLFNNDLSDNTSLAINNLSSSTVNASGNAWGTNVAPAIVAKLNGSVDYTPWLEVPTDTSAAPGFQGGFDTLTVDDDSPQAGTIGRIQEGVNFLTPGGLLRVLAGTYAENVLVDKSAFLRGPNFNLNPNVTTRGAEAVVVPAVTATSLQGSTSGSVFRLGTSAGHIDVNIDGFTIDGHNPSLTGGRMLNGVEVHTGAGIVNSIGSFDTNPGGYDVKMIVRNNIIQNLERYGVLADGVPSTAPLAGTDVSSNKIDNLPSGNNFGGGRGRAVAFEENHYGSFTNNVVTRVNVGWQNDNYYLPSPGAGTLVQGNEIHTYHRGIFHNLQYNSATPATINGNGIFVETDGDFAASTTNFGIELSSIQGTVGVTVSDNLVSGTVYGILLWNLPSSGNITVSGGTLTNNTFGILATNNDPQFGAVSASTSAVISGVTVSAATMAGIKVEDHPDGAATGLVSLTVEDATKVNNSPTGILVSGTNASATIQNNTSPITGNSIAIDIDAGSATVTANLIAGNVTGIRVTNGGSLTSASSNIFFLNTGDGIVVTATAGSVGPISNNDLSGNTGFAVNNASAAVVNASGNWFGSNTPAGVAAKVSSNVDYTPWLDDPSDTSTDAGFQGDFATLHVDDGSPQAGATGRIQEGIDLAAGTPTVIVEAGTYAESVTVNKMNLILRGATGSAADVVIDPTSGDGITVSATGATIRDLRVTGGMTGIVAANVAALTLANLLLDANSVAGGSLSNVTSVDFTASAGDDTVTVDADDFSATGVQSIGYTGVGSLAFHGDTGSDTFNVTPAVTTTISIDGDAPTPTATPGDRLNVTTTGTADPFLSFTSNASGRTGSYTFDDRGTVSFQEIETLDANVDLTITKDDGATTEVPGTTVSYTITVSNAGGLGIGGVTVADMFPGILSGISFMSVASGGASGNTASGSGNINDTVTLPVGGSITYTVNATINASATGSLSNTATVTVPTGVTDTNTADNTDTDTDTLTPQADLSLVKTFASDTVSAGATGRTFTIVVQNTGPSDAHNLVLDDIVSTQLSVTGITANGGSVSRTGNDLDGSLAALAPGAMWTITVTYSVPPATAPGLVSNTASVTATEDSATGGDSVMVTSAIDLKVNMRKSTSGLNVGSTVKFKVILTNFSTVTATNVQVTAQLPAGLTFVSATPTLGTYNPATGVWTVPALAAGSKAYLKIVARADGTVLGQVATTAQLTGSDQADITPFNNAKTRKVRIADVFRR